MARRFRPKPRCARSTTETGKDCDDVIDRFAQAYGLWEEDPLLVAPDRGESGLSVIHRALPFLCEIIERHRIRPC